MAPPAPQSGRVSPSGRISPAVGRMSPAGRTSPTALGETAKMPGEGVSSRSALNDKLIRILTVIAYLCSVSGAAFMLSLYYIFLWDPAGHGGGESKPAAFHAPEHPTLAAALPSSAPANGSLILRAIANVTGSSER